MKLLLILPLLLSAAAASPAPLKHVVATDDVGSPGAADRVVSGSPWTMPASVKARDHSVIFGNEVVLGYSGLAPGARYEVELTFASDSPNRKVRVLADEAVLANELALPANAEISQTWAVPAAVTGDGRFELRILKLAGENAVLSSAIVRSDKPGKLAPPRILIEFPEVTLTPLPAGSDAKMSLDGTWKFQPRASANIAALDAVGIKSWVGIAVPGQWRNQGHDLPANQTVAYATTFDRPSQWKGQRTKIRFEAVFSDCRVYLNGIEVGSHVGGFTPFECDLAPAIKDCDNLLVVAVTSMSVADVMASASKYACHPLGGISRSVLLFSVPDVHISDVTVRTDFDSAFKDATLDIGIELDATAARRAGSQDVRFTLTGPDGSKIPLKNAKERIKWQKAGRVSKTYSFPVTAPRWWTPESPELYHLEIACGKQVIHQPVGFREIEVKGTRVLVNGRPVKLRGINRHEADPLRGRSLAPGQWHRDVELFRDANVNLIRTCHYPPDHQLVEAGDKLGVWIEVEAPFCWENESDNPAHRTVALRQTAEMIKRDRNNPSVLFWSLGNESVWGKNFDHAGRMIRELDPTRPGTFEWMTSGIVEADAARCQIGVVHYPGFNGPVMARKEAKRPLWMGEYCHLNAYNRRELITDPGLRDRWGLYLHRLWEQMQAEPNILGGAIWSGIDDTFFPSPELTLGYGAWGPIDGWRRPKPEYWHMAKAYSPIRIDETRPAAIENGQLVIEVENRSDFTSLSRHEVRWKLGGESGVARTDVPPQQRGPLTIKPATPPAPGSLIELSFRDPRGFEANRFLLPVARTLPEPAQHNNLGTPQLATSDQAYQVRLGAMEWSIDRQSGAVSASAGGIPVVTGGPHLMLIPHNNEGETQMMGRTVIHDAFSPVCKDWKLSEVRAESPGDDKVRISILGAYKEAAGGFTLGFSPGGVNFTYQFAATEKINPRQTGVAFDFPGAFDRLDWKRLGLWSAYPEDHIGRLEGSARAVTPDGKPAIEIGPRDNPGSVPWGRDNTRYGANDFRSTKENILRASLSMTAGGPAFSVFSDGDQSVRAWIEPGTGNVRLLVAGYSNGGSERFLQGLVAPDKRPLKAGDTVSAQFQVNIRK